MTDLPIRLGLAAIPKKSARVEGDLLDWRRDTYYRIAAYDTMDAFLINVMSDSDLWMYISSRGGLTAGRENPYQSLFPYETVDKLHVSHSHTGPKSVIRYVGGEEIFIWQPFAEDGRLRYEIERSVFKHLLGCEVWFEERNTSLGLVLRYGWRPSDRFGWIRTAEVINEGPGEARLEILDGVQNLLPAGIGTGLQDSFSCLVDAYKTAECYSQGNMAVYRLTSNIIDRAEASESLRATVAWQAGLPRATLLLHSGNWEEFVLGGRLSPQCELHGRRGSYLLKDGLTVAPGGKLSWHIALDTPVDQAGVVWLRRLLDKDMCPDIEADLARGRDRLSRLLAAADAFQLTGDRIGTAHHVSNVLYNIGRGGVLPDQYDVYAADLADFVKARNRVVAERYAGWLQDLPSPLRLPELHRRASATGHADLIRLCYEYMPLVFSRRHGDPSRPWNRFSIVMKKPDGSPLYAYEGNWRDIFQNWEALCRSFPECLESCIAKFVNASTMDGFNPYRITRDGIDWELADPDDPWSSIGYWGDHQIVYLLRLLETSLAHHPARLPALLARDIFCYADVPYNIRPYADILKNARKTIDFDWDRQRLSDERGDRIGSDGRLVHRGGSILHVNLAEKLLVPILAKLSNLVPGGGIWMNTMRPEWNDANNALVGNGISVVTACYLHRHLGFCADLFENHKEIAFEMSSRVADWLDELRACAGEYSEGSMDDRKRRAFMDSVGESFSKYRAHAYREGPGERRSVGTGDIVSLLRGSRELVKSTIRSNRREDGLYNAYNILHLAAGSASVTALPLMLEGQVAVLDSGLLRPEEALDLLGALRASRLYRGDQHSYVLYPEEQLPAYLMKNRVPDSILVESPTLAAMVNGGNGSILTRDADGQLRFNADLHNAGAVEERLGEDFPEVEARAVLDAYERVFNHRAFTGRSGTMYRYEGIGCIYWHMVAKLLLAAQAAFERAAAGGAPGDIVEGIRDRYFDIRAGLGFAKTPGEFGAFPLDPYSHTPPFGGAKQPGMTGQVKEEILCRWGELGVEVQNGRISFRPRLLKARELLNEPATYNYIDGSGREASIPLEAGSLSFTFCQVPVVYVRGRGPRVIIVESGGNEIALEGDTVPAALAGEIFGRTGRVRRVEVHVGAGWCRESRKAE